MQAGLQYCPGSATRCSNLHQLQRDIRQCVHGQLRQLLCWLNTGYMHNKQRLDLQWSLRTDKLHNQPNYKHHRGKRLCLSTRQQPKW